MGMDPYPNKAADTNPNCFNCLHGHANQINIEKVGEYNYEYEYQSSDGSYAGDEYFFSQDDDDEEEEEEEEVKPINLHGFVRSACKAVVVVDVHSLPLR